MRIGFHVWAVRLKIECLQLFARNPRGWRARAYPKDDVARFHAILHTHGIAPLVVHACYLVNLASPDRGLRERSVRAVADDMERADLLAGRVADLPCPSAVVVRAGHHMGAGVTAALRTLARSVRSLLASSPPNVELLLENSAGRGTELGGEWQQFAQLLDLLNGDARVGVCFDTCHAHAAGYRMDSARQVARTLAGFRNALGLPRLRLVHLNDCRGAAGAHRDLHEHIGKGTIGDAGFRALLRRKELQGHCGILETPIERPSDDLRNVRHVRELMQ